MLSGPNANHRLETTIYRPSSLTAALMRNIAIHLPFTSRCFCKSMALCSFKNSITCTTTSYHDMPPVCIMIFLTKYQGQGSFGRFHVIYHHYPFQVTYSHLMLCTLGSSGPQGSFGPFGPKVEESPKMGSQDLSGPGAQKSKTELKRGERFTGGFVAAESWLPLSE